MNKEDMIERLNLRLEDELVAATGVENEAVVKFGIAASYHKWIEEVKLMEKDEDFVLNP